MLSPCRRQKSDWPTWIHKKKKFQMCLQCMVSRIVLALPLILLGSSSASCTYSNLLQTLTDLEKGQPHYKEQVPCNCSLCSYKDERLLFELPQLTRYCSLSQKGCWISMKGPILWYLSADFYYARIYINEFPSQIHQSKIQVKIAIQTSSLSNSIKIP